MYEYRAKIISVYDGDTFTAEVDLGFKIKLTETFRVYGIDTPEIKTQNNIEKLEGERCRDYLRDKILNKDVRLAVYKQEKYGRYLAEIIYKDEITGETVEAGKQLVSLGMAKVYFGEKKVPFTEKTIEIHDP